MVTIETVDFPRPLCCRVTSYMRRYLSVSGRLGLCRAILVAGLAMSTVSCAKIEARDLIREGNKAYAEGRFVDAIDKYTESLEYEKDGVTVFWNRACAAEAQVLKMSDPDDAEERRKYADMALQDFQKWYEHLSDKTEEDEKLVQQHRLTILDADQRCDELLQYWMDKHKAAPKEEQWYGVIFRQYEKCDQPDKATEWLVKRTRDFPDSVRAWHALAIRKYEPLWPDPDTELPYNEQIPMGERLEIADEVIGLLDKATELDPKFRDAYAWRKMAYTQRQHARVYVDEPEMPEERLEAILAREDSLLAWKEQKAICDLDEIPDCPGLDDPPLEEGQQCCPPPPLSATEQAEDAEAKNLVLEEIEAAKAAAQEEAKKGKRRRKRR